MSDKDEDRLRQLLARDEIRQLAYRYAAAIEARDIDGMAELFATQARFGEHGEGPDGLRRLMTDSLSDTLFAVIMVANHLIEFDAEGEAHGEVWAHCFAHTHADGFTEQLLKYRDHYVYQDGRWVFLHRRHHLWYGVGREPSPLRQPAANWPDSQIGVGDLPLADPVFVQWWATQP
jgi:hypothetical protein